MCMGHERRSAEDSGYLLTRANLNIGANKMATYCNNAVAVSLHYEDRLRIPAYPGQIDLKLFERL